ncbi:hypothetical protein F0562_011497 [Nyssa sinensis]|uniref:Exostosin GT47 domain-containing protein n=1 Tax=Nyssa sinensis TaxID=561372 RepID=A0A5J4ZSK5_9ASTE|nr:hypothetical protein F0562_011497 [Nyssa sinensis]
MSASPPVSLTTSIASLPAPNQTLKSQFHLSTIVPLTYDTKSNVKEKIVDVVLENPAPVVKVRDEEVTNALKVVEEQLQLHRSWTSDSNHANCEGRGMYVYEMPTKFNKDLMGQCGDMIPWVDFCKYFSNEALGQPITELGKGWYQTHQYSLEPIFHSRVMKHPCRVYNEDEAKLFYVPFYGGLDILRWHFKNVSNDVKDSLALELLKWLELQRPWVRNSAYYQYPWHLPEDHKKYSVFIDKEEVREMKVDVVERLMKVDVREREDMRRYIVYELLPGLVYGDPSSELEKFQDAFSITMNNLLERVSRLE